MTTIDEMEFVDWNNAAPSMGGVSAAPQHNSNDGTDPNLNLALENVTGDDFSFWALEHFDTHSSGLSVDNSMQLPVSQPLDNGHIPVGEFWDTPSAPCDHCKLGGYQCKTIPEGKYKGYCTSCVALRRHCSLGPQASDSPAPGASTFPPNPWPTLGDHPNSIANEELDILLTTSAPALPSLAANSAHANPSPKPVTTPKIGARFSRESVKILKNWLSTHSRHPYPTDEEKESLQRQTGLNKTQITNWLANARRRGKVQAPRSTSPHPRSTWAGAVDIPRRRGTPVPFESMGPLERWVDSPPENEPAAVSDIARAVRASSGSVVSSGINSSYSGNDDKSLCNWSSASSLGTSHSSTNSFASAYSHGSRGSIGSLGSLNNRGRRRRRRRPASRRPEEKTALTAPLKTYQCTFCTDTFRTKHDWQRHEKSLHLSLERWVCAPSGPRVPSETTGMMCCVFCGIENPDDAHIDSHNYCACQERTLDERTFYRKDHLRQHLKLVHNVKFLASTMEPWKVATPEIRSRCGFCGIIMDSWTFRIDHIAEHFKTGYSMADWKGDWGFDAPVLEMVENSIPPFLIHDERNSPLPYTADKSPSESPRNAYEMLKVELGYLIRCRVQDAGRVPTDNELRHEAMRIIFGSEVLSRGGIASVPSWLRDLLFSDAELAEKARMERVRSAAENRLSSLKIHGKDNIFEGCPLEQQLHEFVEAKRLVGLTPMDDELEEEACGIIGRIEETSSYPQDEVANWLIRLIKSSPDWLAPFRRRASLPRSEDVGGSQRSKDPKTIDSTVHNYSRLETELAEYVEAQRSQGHEPTDLDLQRQARLIIYEFDDAWNQTAADNEEWLYAFRQRHLKSQTPVDASAKTNPTLNVDPMQLSAAPTPLAPACPAMSPNAFVKLRPYFLNDANCYRRLARELARWVASVTSPNNPNRHTPTDREIQHQARWVLYDDDDPWNQTAADNEEWLRRFKRDVGLLNDGGPGLPETDAWAVKLGGSGFAPPYAFPKPEAPIAASFTDNLENHKVQITLKDGCKPFEAEASTANKFLQTLTSRFEPLPKVFCPRELENGLVEFVRTETAQGREFPSDEALKAQARLILGTETTPADDAVLLEKFKDMARGSAPAGVALASPSASLGFAAAGMASASPARVPSTPEHDVQMTGISHLDPDEPIQVNMTESELDSLLKDMNFEFVDPDLAASTAMGLDFSPENFG